MKKCTNSVDYTEIGIRIKQHRTKQGVTQQKLAELTGLSVAYLSQIERGNATASLHSLITIAKALHLSLDWLIYDLLPQSSYLVDNDIGELISDCTTRERRFILESIRTTKSLIRNYLSQEGTG